jgi:hypothetical protein
MRGLVTHKSSGVNPIRPGGAKEERTFNHERLIVPPSGGGVTGYMWGKSVDDGVPGGTLVLVVLIGPARRRLAR